MVQVLLDRFLPVPHHRQQEEIPGLHHFQLDLMHPLALQSGIGHQRGDLLLTPDF